MSVITSQQTARFFEQFSTTDITFTREVIKATLLYPKQIFLKCGGYQWPCILFSSSMTGAKIIANVQNNFKQIVGRTNNMVSLRYSFIQRDKPDPVSFFVNARILDYSPYTSDNPDLNFLNLSFTNRPPDELIHRLGALLEANTAAQNRREERINMTADAVRELNLNLKGSVVIVDSVPRKCIIRDLSFSGIKVIIMGVAKFLVNKNATVRFLFTDPNEIIDIKGKVIRFEPIEGRQDVGAFVIQFEEADIPVDYKLRVTNYFKQQRGKKVPLD
jgi:hypothetical protein